TSASECQPLHHSTDLKPHPLRENAHFTGTCSTSAHPHITRPRKSSMFTGLLSGTALISHMVSCPRPAWMVFVIFFLLRGFARHFSRRRRCFDAILCSNAHFLPEVKTPPPLLPWFSCDCFYFSSSEKGSILVIDTICRHATSVRRKSG